MITASEPETSYMEHSAARHQIHPSTSSSKGQFTFVTYPAPFKNLKEEFSRTLDIKDMSKLSPLTIAKALQRAFFRPCEALFSNTTAIKVL